MKKMMGDVRVIGMVAGNHVIEDIGRDVAFRTLVIIPEEQALMSKDLWRAISQGFLCQVPSAPYPSAASAPDPEKVRLEKYAAQLEALAVRLQNENEALKHQLEGSAHAHSDKLDQILKAIQSGVAVAPPAAVASAAPSAVAAASAPVVVETVDGTAPTFLPGQIRDKDLDARISIQGEESTSDAVTEAADLLRQIRKKERSP